MALGLFFIPGLPTYEYVPYLSIAIPHGCTSINSSQGYLVMTLQPFLVTMHSTGNSIAGSTGAVLGRTVSLKRKDHILFQDYRLLHRDAPG